jgi:serine/threonine protein kinase
LLTGTPPFTGPTVDVVMRQHLDAPPPPVTRTDVPAELSGLVTRLLAKDPADRPSSAGEVAALLNAPSNLTQVLALPAGEEPLDIGHWQEDDPETGHRAPGKAFPLAKFGVAAAAVLAALTGAILLKEAVTSDPPTAQAGGTPSAPVHKVSTAPKTTPTPTSTPTKTPAKKPTPKQTPKQTPRQNPQAAVVHTLRSLAAQVRATQQQSRSKAPREAAADLDKAAEALDHGDTSSAAQHFYDARRRLAEAQQRHRWQATPQIATLFSAVSQVLPRPDGDHGGNNSGGNSGEGE